MLRAELILASASAGRAAVLRDAGLPFHQEPAYIDERAIEAEAVLEDGVAVAEQVARRLAQEKAIAVSLHHPDAIVIGADQVMTCEDRIFHKPADLAAARKQLGELRGREHLLTAGLAVAMRGKVEWHHLDTARLQMRDFSDAFLDTYISQEGKALLGSVGAYRIEGLGIQLFSSVEGSHFTIIGLPLLPLLGYLRQIGWLQS
jgi:septum formation protein